jgi:replicative DNA helicase
MLSEEMSALQLGKRSLLRISDFDEEDWRSNVSQVRGEVDRHYRETSPIYVVENCNSVESLEAVLDQFVSIHGVRLAAVDYLQLLGGRDVNRYEVVTEVSRRLKQAARRNDVALLVLSQVNREIDKRDQRRPKLSDLRESGQIEQDADLVMFLQWPNRFDNSVAKDVYRIFVAKRRNGPIRAAEIETSFDDSRQTVGSTIS